MKALEKIDLSYNELEDANDRIRFAWKSMGELREVNLSYNGLKIAPTFALCPKLKRIEINNNVIDKIGAEVLDGLHNL